MGNNRNSVHFEQNQTKPEKILFAKNSCEWEHRSCDLCVIQHDNIIVLERLKNINIRVPQPKLWWKQLRTQGGGTLQNFPCEV